jgi:hypothetical protein
MQNSTLKLTRVEEFASNNVNANNQALLFTAAAAQTTTGDLKLTDDCFITGAVLRTNTSAFGDYAVFQVVDVDNILGYGAGTVLGQYVNKWYMRSDAQEQANENTPYPAKILAGLYLRLIYTSVGLMPVSVAINYRLHKALY